MKKLLSKLLVLTLLVTSIGTAQVFAAPLFIFDSDTGTITGYNGSGGDVEIPSTIGGVDVVSIGDRAFLNKQLTSRH